VRGHLDEIVLSYLEAEAPDVPEPAVHPPYMEDMLSAEYGLADVKGDKGSDGSDGSIGSMGSTDGRDGQGRLGDGQDKLDRRGDHLHTHAQDNDVTGPAMLRGCWVLGIGCWYRRSPTPNTYHPTPTLWRSLLGYQLLSHL